MKTINVASAFSIVHADAVLKFEPGVQPVEDWVADHWYTEAHLAHGGFGTPEYAEGARATAEQKCLAARDAAEEYRLALEASQAADEAAGIEEREPPHIAIMTVAGEAPQADPLDADNDGKMGGSLDAFDQKTNEELAELITAATGTRPHPNTGRAKLLEKARQLPPAADQPADEAGQQEPQNGDEGAPQNEAADEAAGGDDQADTSDQVGE